MPVSDLKMNKFRAALEVLQRGRDQLVESLAEDIVEQGDDILDGGYQLQEFLENQGTKLHFLSLLVAQLEQSAEALEEERLLSEPPPPPRPRSRKPRKPDGKKVARQASPEHERRTDEG